MPEIVIPPALAALHARHEQDAGPAWTAALPALARRSLDRWDLRLDGAPMHGIISLVLPVVRPDGTPAALKLQPVTEETRSEGPGLRAWAGDGAVLLLDADPAGEALLLERLDGERSLENVPDPWEALEILTGLMARLIAVPAPPGMRSLADVATGMLADVPAAMTASDDRRWLDTCAGAVRDLAGEPGDRLLHWDLHYGNVLAGHREPWLAIDPKPLAGDPGFELLPALHNRWHDVTATGNIRKCVLKRFDFMTEMLDLDRTRAIGWTLGRILQDALWDLEDGHSAMDPIRLAIADALLSR
ncbi:hydroxyurea phosphotransferase [Acrocarpospora phusangensis]|uniref:Hydroxyurea phosphotransferase n=1 Tax=Acrocarpospora phusangensis TaxID=1070424 RepID=A0A919QBN9_9ACTN|nr:aminoglycoside phosphotransferase family protein [Acrocarpospora phusangensis]GIH24405.1 hydroxyurea phosphotransferase [Acrocarpospora phusangensis]